MQKKQIYAVVVERFVRFIINQRNHVILGNVAMAIACSME